MSGKKLHFGIIGAGTIGRVHAESLAFRMPEAEIVSTFDIKREAAETLAAHCSIPNVAGSVEEIFADKRIEAVAICASTDAHAEPIVHAAQASTSFAKNPSHTRWPPLT